MINLNYLNFVLGKCFGAGSAVLGHSLHGNMPTPLPGFIGFWLEYADFFPFTTLVLRFDTSRPP